MQAGGQTHVRLPVRVGAGAKAVVVERQTGTGDAFVSSVANVIVGDGAELTWLIVQEQPDTTTYLGQFNAWIGKDAKLIVFVMNAGGKLVRQEINVLTKGEGSTFTLRGINLLAGDTHTDVTMVLDHAVPHTASTEVIRNVVTGKARGVFQGRINVHQYAQKTDAKMACNTLLLSDDGEFSTKPELEIFADDVVCGHGATVTEIDRNHLFYLMARGIEEKTARGLLVKAFVAEVIEELEDEKIVEALEGDPRRMVCDTWLGQRRASTIASSTSPTGRRRWIFTRASSVPRPFPPRVEVSSSGWAASSSTCMARTRRASRWRGFLSPGNSDLCFRWDGPIADAEQHLEAKACHRAWPDRPLRRGGRRHQRLLPRSRWIADGVHRHHG